MRVALLTGGTGGAKLAHGFQQVLPGGSLDVIVNVGDDLELFGLHVSPDLDSVLYTLAGLVDRERGWGVAGDTHRALTMLERYGEETWFWLGHADLGTLVRRPPSCAGAPASPGSRRTWLLPWGYRVTFCPRPMSGCGPGSDRRRGH